MSNNWEDNWMQFREESMNYMKNLHGNALKKYVNEAGFKDTFAYEYNYSTHKFTIYTSRPGVWIGKGGTGVDRLKEILLTELKKSCEIEFKEIRGEFVICK